MTAARWDRLAEDLTAAGFDAQVDVRHYTEDRYGRVHHGITRKIELRHGPELVTIFDTWWPRNLDVWTGYQVCVERSSDGILRRAWPRTKKRSEVVAAVREAVA